MTMMIAMSVIPKMSIHAKSHKVSRNVMITFTKYDCLLLQILKRLALLMLFMELLPIRHWVDTLGLGVKLSNVLPILPGAAGE